MKKLGVFILAVLLGLGSLAMTVQAEDWEANDGWRRQGDQRLGNNWELDQAEINRIRDSLQSQGAVQNSDTFRSESDMRRDYGGKQTSRGGARQDKFESTGDIT